MSNSIRIKNRDGVYEPLDISKIQKKTSKAVHGLSGVSQSELEVDAQIQFFDGISTEQIQEAMISTAVGKIDIDRPNWTFVAARLFLTDLYHRFGKKTQGQKGQRYCSLEKYLKVGEEKGRILKGLRGKFDLSFLDGKIDDSRDLLFTYLGIKTLYDRYILKDKDGEPIELPQHLFMGVAMFLAQNETNPESLEYLREVWGDEKFEDNTKGLSLEDPKAIRSVWASAFYDVISKFEAMLATPTLSNARTPRHQLSSCYVNSVPDNIEGIFDAYKEFALLSKFGGGIGSDWTKIRSIKGYIDGHKNAAGGVIPFLKITNDIAVAVDQLGTRKGAIAVYVEPWHGDLMDFLDLKKNSGEERRRAHDLFPALWLNDLFMKRVENDENWTLFNPEEVSDLADCYGDEFERRYIAYENDPDIEFKEVFKAKDIWRKVLTQYFETGTPFLCHKDAANRANPNKHTGIVRSSNLCTEIFQNTSPNHYVVKVEFSDGDIRFYEEDDVVETSDGVVKNAKKITSIDYLPIDGEVKKVEFAEKVAKDGETAVCNLASINLSKVNTREDFERVVPVVMRMLDNVIDLNFYPVRKTMETNSKTRAVGLGVMGEAQMLAESQVTWGSQEHMDKVDEIMEAFSYNAIAASTKLAKEKGSYDLFNGSDWSKGVLPFDHTKAEVSELTSRDLSYDWDALREAVKGGMRNGYLMAIAPTSSISILTGTSQAIEPIYKRKWFEENLSGLIPVVAPNLNADNYRFYETAYDMDQLNIIKAGAIRQKWIDQGQSLNIFIRLDRASAGYLNRIYTTAWKLGIKSNYYLRSESPESKDSVADRSIECAGCQ